jgi:hypothetical protein
VAEKEAQRRELVVKKLHSILKPFLLRRIKSDVETNLPRKKEIVLYASMSETQQTVGACAAMAHCAAYIHPTYSTSVGVRMLHASTFRRAWCAGSWWGKLARIGGVQIDTKCLWAEN